MKYSSQATSANKYIGRISEFYNNMCLETQILMLDDLKEMEKRFRIMYEKSQIIRVYDRSIGDKYDDFDIAISNYDIGIFVYLADIDKYGIFTQRNYTNLIGCLSAISKLPQLKQIVFDGNKCKFILLCSEKTAKYVQNRAREIFGINPLLWPDEQIITFADNSLLRIGNITPVFKAFQAFAYEKNNKKFGNIIETVDKYYDFVDDIKPINVEIADDKYAQAKEWIENNPPLNKISTKLYYQQYCDENKNPIHHTKFGPIVTSLGYETLHGTKGRYWVIPGNK